MNSLPKAVQTQKGKTRKDTPYRWNETKPSNYKQKSRSTSGILFDKITGFLILNVAITNWLITTYTHRVVYQIKDTIFWKQITTVMSNANIGIALFIRSKIQFFESKSQLCISSIILFWVVYQIKDTIFWKQITTFKIIWKLKR